MLRKATLVAVPGLLLAGHYLKETIRPIHAKQVIEDDELKQSHKQIDLKEFCKFKNSKNDAKSLIEATRIMTNAPGIACAVSYRGKMLWSFGQGLADVETRAPCTEKSVMRIASISKPITMMFLGKLIEDGKLDLDKPISEYLNEKIWPQKYWQGKKVDITLRQLVAHLSGIRHYNYPKGSTNDSDSQEFFLNEQFDDSYQGLKIFKDDDLLHEPGQKFLYSSFAFTLISAVIQSVLDKEEKKFEKELIKMCKEELFMCSTYLDTNATIIPDRAKYYTKSEGANHSLLNTRQVNNSYKVAGGGLLSNVHDLLKFGNAMLYSYKTDDGILKRQTMHQFWKPNDLTDIVWIKDVPFRYGQGWFAHDEKRSRKYKGLQMSSSMDNAAFHSGGAVGVTSWLLILPESEIVVVILSNLQNCKGLGVLAMNIAKCIIDDIENDKI